MSEFWILVTILVVGFILTWIFCSKMPDTNEFDSKPGAFFPMEDSEKITLRMEKMALERKVYTLERELYYRRYDRPVEVNVDVKVENNETTSKSSCR